MDIKRLLGSFCDVILGRRVMSELEQIRPGTSVSYDHSKPALLFGSDHRRRARAEQALRAFNVRLVDSLPLKERPIGWTGSRRSASPGSSSARRMRTPRSTLRSAV